MEKKQSFRNYYEEYLDVCSSISRTSGLPDLWKLVKKENAGISLSFPFGTCLIDYSTKKYVYLSDNLRGIISYPKADYMQEGIGAHAHHFHPEDKVIFAEHIFRDIREFWKRIPPGEIQNYRISFNHRYFRNDGTISQFLQHSTYLEPQYSGMPILNLLTFSDVSDFVSDTSLVLSISCFVPEQGYVKIFSKSYPQQRKMVLSLRESEIIRLCLEGLSSKMIADKLFLSIHTVKNHKRNMMDKTSARNIAELINLALKNKWV